MIEWGGAQRWLSGDVDIEALRQRAGAAGGGGGGYGIEAVMVYSRVGYGIG